METRVDKFGRVVIPKLIRIHLGLRSGVTLSVEEREQDVLLRPVREASCVAVKDGVVVFTGVASGELQDALRRHRDERLSQLTPRLRR